MAEKELKRFSFLNRSSSITGFERRNTIDRLFQGEKRKNEEKGKDQNRVSLKKSKEK